MFSFFATNPLGFNHPKIANDDFLNRARNAAILKPSNADIYTVEYAEFVETLKRVAGVPGFDHYFFVEGGALAVENALKTAFDWKIRKNLEKGKTESQMKVIHFQDAFHGRSGYTLSLTNTFERGKTDYFPKFDWPRITNPKCTFPMDKEATDAVETLEEQALSEINKAIESDSDNIAALIIEPIQSEGGDNHFRKEFFESLRRVCDTHNILFIVDEVQTGLGITGKTWCMDHFGVQPDIYVFGKKAQVAGILCNDRIDDVDSVFKVSGRINSTWGGNLLDMVRATRILEIIEEDKLIDRAATIGAKIQNALHDFSKADERITNVRGRGLMIAFDLPDTETRNTLRETMYNDGILVLPCGPRSIRIRPSLTFDANDAGTFIDGLQKALSR
jgi:L-lysine 6-transaminase